MKAVLLPALLLLGMSVPALAQSTTSRPTPSLPELLPALSWALDSPCS
jgi:hypothetical protein